MGEWVCETGSAIGGLGEWGWESGAGRVVGLADCGCESGDERVGLGEWGWESGAGRVGLGEWG